MCRGSDAHGGCSVYPILAFPSTFVPVLSRPSPIFRSTCRVCHLSSPRPQSPSIGHRLSQFVFVLVYVVLHCLAIAAPTIPPIGFYFVSAAVSASYFCFSASFPFRLNLDFLIGTIVYYSRRLQTKDEIEERIDDMTKIETNTEMKTTEN